MMTCMKEKCMFCGGVATQVCIDCGLFVCERCRKEKGFGSLHRFEEVSE